MQQSRLPASGANLFQTIKVWSSAAEQCGRKLIKLSIGQPAGPAFGIARQNAAMAVMLDKESMHEYQDNGSPGIPNFAQYFIQHHVSTSLEAWETAGGVSFLPIPGIKPMLIQIPLACGASSASPIKVMTTTKPGYPKPADVCGYLGGMVSHSPIELNLENRFLFNSSSFGECHLAMINYPHNPSGQIAERHWLEGVCGYCQEHNIRLFNDAAYAKLASSEHATLTDVALKYPQLSWAEAFSASKLGNLTGWRIGAIVGSPDFVSDIAKIKGNIDSGFFAPAAFGALRLVREGQGLIDSVRQVYEQRIENLIRVLSQAKMELVIKPRAGFFTLWLTPKRAFGQEIADAEAFNRLMIERTGVVGVHFGPYIRYSVAYTDPIPFLTEIQSAFEKAEVSY